MRRYFKYIVLILIMFCFLSANIYSYKINNKNYSKNEIKIKEKVINNIYRKKFKAKNNNLEKIEFKFSNNNGQLYIKILNSNGKKIKEKKLDLSTLNSSKAYMMEFNRINNSRNQNYIIEINGMNYDGKIQNINVYYYQNQNSILYALFLIIISCVSIILSIIFIKKNIKIENIFLILAIFIYTTFMLVFPLFTTHDELYHWFRAYEVSEGGLLSDINDNKALSKLPIAISEIYNKVFFDIDYRTLKQTYNIHLDNNNRVYHDMSAVALYSPVQYMPQAVGIALSRIVTDRPLIMAYCGRAMNSLFAIILIYFAIKLIPFGKRVLFIISFLPISIEGFTSLSADGITISISMFLIAYILNITYNKNIEYVTKKDYFIILISSIILSLCKIVYIPMVLLTFIIPRNKFKNKKQYLIFNLSIILTSTICNLLWLGIASRYLNLYNDSKVAVSAEQLSPTKQIMSIFKHPFNYVQMVVYTFFINFKSYLFTMLGENLGWGELVYPFSIVPIGYFVILIINSIFDKKSNDKLNVKSNCLISFILICVIGLIFTSLYVQFTPPGYNKIIGVQGRYFIPIFPLVLILFSNFKNYYSNSINYEKITCITCLMLSYSVLLTIFTYFL